MRRQCERSEAIQHKSSMGNRARLLRLARTDASLVRYKARDAVTLVSLLI